MCMRARVCVLQMDVAAAQRALGSVSAGYGSKMDGQVILYLASLVDLGTLPKGPAGLVSGLFAKCAIFAAKPGR